MIFYTRKNTTPVKKRDCDGQNRLPKVQVVLLHTIDDVIISIICALFVSCLQNEVKTRLGCNAHCVSGI